jgi:hypothetical protein
MPSQVRDWERVVAHCGTYKLGRIDTKRNEEAHDTWEARKGFRRKTQAVVGPPIIEMTFKRHERPSETKNNMSSRAGVQYRVIL